MEGREQRGLDRADLHQALDDVFVTMPISLFCESRTAASPSAPHEVVG